MKRSLLLFAVSALFICASTYPANAQDQISRNYTNAISKLYAKDFASAKQILEQVKRDLSNTSRTNDKQVVNKLLKNINDRSDFVIYSTNGDESVTISFDNEGDVGELTKDEFPDSLSGN